MIRLLPTAFLLFLLAATGVNAESAQGPLIVQTAREHITLSGYTRSRAKMTVASEVAGKVLAVNYDIGQAIEKKPFVEIDPTFIDFQIERLRASLEKLLVTKSRSTSRAAFLEKEYLRIDKLRQNDVTSESRYDAAAQEYEQARLELQTVTLEITNLETQLRELREQRKRHSVFAPKGWIVVMRRVEPGEIISAGNPLAQVADYDRLVVPLSVSGKELAAIRETDKIPVVLEGEPASASIHWVNPEFDERTRKLAVELVLQDFKGTPRGGLLVELTVDISSGGLMVPKLAVSDRYDNPRVTLKSNGQSIPIVILGENGTHIMIADNGRLSPGQELVSQQLP